MDGHVDFVQIPQGLNLTTDYTVVPFQDLQSKLMKCREEVPGE